MLKISLIGSITLFLSACSTNYSFNSNLDKENFQDYVTASKVTVYEAEQFDTLNNDYLGVVEGLSCQATSKQPPPQEVDARNDAREQAAALGANAIVFQSCFTLEEPANCLAELSCFGKAYRTSKQ